MFFKMFRNFGWNENKNNLLLLILNKKEIPLKKEANKYQATFI